MAVFRNVEIAKAGEWMLAVGGRQKFTVQDFEDAVAASQDPALGIRRRKLRVGHVDPRFDGEPAAGRVTNLRVVGDRLFADFEDVPDDFAKDIHAKYPDRSIEGARRVTTIGGRNYGLVVTGVSLLGRTDPAIEGLADLPPAIAAAERIAASAAEMGLPWVPAADETSEAASSAPATVPNDTPRQGGAVVTISELRARLGLPDDTPDADVLKAVAEKLPEPKAVGEGSPPGDGKGAGESSSGPSPAPAAEATPPAATEGQAPPPPNQPAQTEPKAGEATTTTPVPSAPEGFIAIEKGILEQLQRDAAMGVAAAKRQAQEDEDRFVERIAAAGKLLPPSNPGRSHTEANFRREWRRNPGEAEALAAASPTIVPVAAAGHDYQPDGTLSDGWSEAEMSVFPELREVRGGK